MVDSGRSARSHDPAVSERSGPAGVGSRAACRRLWSQRCKFLRRIIRSPRRRAVESIAAPERLGGKQLQPFARQCHGRDLFHQRNRGEASPKLVPDPGVRQQGHRLMADLLGIRKVLLGQIFQRMTASCECDPLSETTASSALRASSSHSFARRNQTNLCRSISDEAASWRQLSAWRRSSSPLRASQGDRVSVRSREACTIPTFSAPRQFRTLPWPGHPTPDNTVNVPLTSRSVE